MATVSIIDRGYMPVATASLCPAAVLECDLYIQRPGCPYAELFREGAYPMTAVDIQRLRDDGVDHLYIRAEAAEAYREYLCEHVLHDASVPTAVRMDALREVTRVAFQGALVSNDCDAMVSVAGEFGGDLASLASEREVAFGELYKTLKHDYYTFTHMCNVAVYCTMLAGQLGRFQQSALAEIAAGALLHDIGKRQIPPHILNKPAKLTDEEWELVREHPGSGFRELATRPDVTWDQLMMVYQHHERLDGSGYPAGIMNDEIHFWAKICAVADVFDALTCQRPYRRAMPVRDVCEYLSKYAGTWFDAELVHCWVAHIQTTAVVA
jgi:HD-GYP domain-containing protein (c-di-GMP phosphodiesterase class II)